jgi:hypothetical protein
MKSVVLFSLISAAGLCVLTAAVNTTIIVIKKDAKREVLPVILCIGIMGFLFGLMFLAVATHRPGADGVL